MRPSLGYIIAFYVVAGAFFLYAIHHAGREEPTDEEMETEEALAIQNDWERRARHEPNRW